METTCVRPVMNGVLAALALALVLGGVALAAEDPRDRALDLLRDGDPAAALPLLRDLAADRPGDAVVLYNLACAEAGAGSAEAAVTALRAALAAGFEDLDLLQGDPDLAALHDDPAFTELVTEETSRLILLARERGADLAEGRRTEPLPLTGDPAVGAPELRLRWLPLGLEIEVTGGAPWSGLADREAAPPWSGGPALLVTLAVPGQRRDYASANAWLLAFGVVNKQPAGALYLAGRDQWQPVGELDPRLDVDDRGRLRFRATIPWRTIRPFHPLSDPELGLNVVLRTPRDGGGFHVVELLPDPARFVPATPRRRAVLLTFDPASTAAEAFVGRLADSVSRGGVLALDFTTVVQQGGRGSLGIDFLDAAGRSVLPGGARAAGLDLAAGVNRLARTADFSGLRMGTYQLQAELVFPAGARAEWSTTILHLPAGWDDDLDSRIAALPEGDRPTAAHLLELVRDALARHVPRRHPGAIATTLDRLTSLLDRAERTGSVLPDEGAFALVHQVGGDSRIVEGFVSGTAGARDRLLPVLVLADAGGYENRVVQRMLLFDTEQPAGPDRGGSLPVYLVPRVPATADESLARTQATLDWSLDYFSADRALLVGVDGMADEALALAARCPHKVAAVAVFAGRRVGLPAGRDALDDLRADLPVTWFDFPLERAAGGKAVQLRDLLRERLPTAVEDRQVRGGLSLSQVADRTVLWARERAATD